MNTSRIVLQRMAPTMLKQTSTRVSRAAFSPECAPAQKLRTVFEEYRKTNFSDELPSRVNKSILKELEEPDHETFQVENLNRILYNIGRHDALLSKDEMNILLRDAGLPPTQRYIPIDKMTRLM